MMGESSVLMAPLPRHPPLAFLSRREESLTQLHEGSSEPLPVEQGGCCLRQKRELEQGGLLRLAFGGLNF